MQSFGEIKSQISRLDGEPADALEDQFLEIKPWDATKDAKENLHALAEGVVCLANAEGGCLLVGVKDRVRTKKEALHGVPADLSLEQVRKALYDNTVPPILVDPRDLVEDGKRLLAIFVPKGLPPHTTASGLGKIRVGKDCKPLTGPEFSRLIFGRGHQDLSARVVDGARFEDLEPQWVKALADFVRMEGKDAALAALPPDQLFVNLNLVHHDGGVTLAALLLAGKSTALARWAPQHEISFLRFSNDTRYDLRHDWKGPILSVDKLLSEALMANTGVTQVLLPGFREMEIPDVPAYAARESVLNAVVHRDYFLSQGVQVELRPDRLVVHSPGGFIGGVTPKNILRHAPVRRNVLLANALQKAGLVNRAGVGVDTMTKELLRAGKSMPRFDADEASVTLTLGRLTHKEFASFANSDAQKTLDLDDLILLRGVVDRGYLDRWFAAERLQLSEEQAAEAMARLRRLEYLTVKGVGRSATYRLAKKYSDLLRGRDVTDADFDLDKESLRLKVQALLTERGRVTNEELRKLSGYSRAEVVQLMMGLRKDGLAEAKGRGRSAHYVPGPKLPGLGEGKPSKRSSKRTAK